MNSKSQLVATLFYNPDREWWARVEGRMNKTGHSQYRQHGSQLTSTSSIFSPIIMPALKSILLSYLPVYPS